ncbi:GAS2-like protein pickled eggs [Condylostylus longicornis]|uniref:GAS2-like protein pickled eggs n=1 Tax=Condylostylus longicornis TaxID=2530218 RepID=UPI00244E17F5|nr:GAS2-like protein pickled eggs [Condylostylus longicornis]XP_055374961.1 GAS2-like protein pickled eggs [Condylostylus longicornis]XP_055374962.1 GAS2-like protein pickled eggs [Condylostylus longicornis]
MNELCFVQKYLIAALKSLQLIMASVLLEAKPYRPFKSSEEYLEAMKEDLAEWLNTMYPELNINADNFMNRLDTGVVLCRHANNVRKAAEDYLVKRQARNKVMSRSVTSGLAGPILANLNVHYLPAAKSGTFFARDNVSNFITWCRKSLKILECLLFETDDLIMRKNEKHVILCLLEVARRGAKFGMLAPMLIQMERQIDREIAADNKANGITSSNKDDVNTPNGQKSIRSDDIIESDSENEYESPMLFYGPEPQIVTNDLKSLHEMVRDLVEKCTCPSQFPMVRVSEGKYRIGDTKVLIFVRILRSHVMVRVGGGWDTLAHYLDKHDPCRCKSAHRTSVAARLIPRTNNQNGVELHKAHVIYERSPPFSRKVIMCQQPSTVPNSLQSTNISNSAGLMVTYNKSRSPTPQKKYLNQQNQNVFEFFPTLASPTSNINKRSISPSPKRLNDIRKKQPLSGTSSFNKITADSTYSTIQNDELLQQKEIIMQSGNSMTIININSNSFENSAKFDNSSDNGSEMSDEGYRSLGLQQINNHRVEQQNQIFVEDADFNARPSFDLHYSPKENKSTSKAMDNCNQSLEHNSDNQSRINSSPSLKQKTKNKSAFRADRKKFENSSEINFFEQSGIFITDDDITVDIAGTTGLRKTGFSDKIYGFEDQNKPELCEKISNNSKIPRSPVVRRRKSIDVLCNKSNLESSSEFNRTTPEYRSAKLTKEFSSTENRTLLGKGILNIEKCDIKNSESQFAWNGRNKKKFYALNEHPVRSSSLNSHFNKKSKQFNTHILYDSNGKTICTKSTSLTTSPIKCRSTASPLAQQLFKVANNAKSDAQMLEKMKILLQKYGKDSNYKMEDFNDSYTHVWVQNNGDMGSLDNSDSFEIKKQRQQKGSIAATPSFNTDFRNSTPYCTKSFLPRSRADYRGASKIPAPVRRNTELY